MLGVFSYLYWNLFAQSISLARMMNSIRSDRSSWYSLQTCLNKRTGTRNVRSFAELLSWIQITLPYCIDSVKCEAVIRYTRACDRANNCQRRCSHLIALPTLQCAFRIHLRFAAVSTNPLTPQCFNSSRRSWSSEAHSNLISFLDSGTIHAKF